MTARLLLLGNVPSELTDAARNTLGPERVSYGGLVSHREALTRASSAAVLLGITTAAEAGGAALTSKLFEYLALRRPILMLAPPGPARTLVASSGAGVAADPDDVTAIMRAIEQLHEEWSQRTERRASDEVLARHTRAETARQVAAALDSATRIGQGDR